MKTGTRGRGSSPALLIAGMCASQVLGMAGFSTFAALLNSFRQEWHLTNAAAGGIGAAYSVGYLLAAALLISWTDRVDARKIYLCSMALGAVANAGFGLAVAGGVSAAAWRTIQGVALAGTYMPGLVAILARLPGEQHSRVTALYTSHFVIGTSFSFFISGELDRRIGWHGAFLVAAISAALATVLAMFVLRPPKGSAPGEAARPERPPRWRESWRVLANWRAVSYSVVYFLHCFELYAFRTWMVAFLGATFARAQGSGTPAALWSPTLIAGATGLLGLPASILGNEAAGRAGRRRFVTGTFMVVSTAVGVAVGLSAHGAPALAAAAVMVYGLTTMLDSSSLTAGVVENSDAGRRGTALAVHSVIGFAGASAGPFLFGLLLDRAGGQGVPVAWSCGWSLLAGVSTVGPVVLALRRRTPRRGVAPPLRLDVGADRAGSS